MTADLIWQTAGAVVLVIFVYHIIRNLFSY